MGTEKMFRAGSINGLQVRNHIIRSATNDHLGNPDGTVSDEEIDMYATLARNEIGTIITGHMSVSPDLGYRADEMQLCIGDDRFVSGLSRIASKIHEYGAVAIAQLSHAGPRGLHPIDFNDLSTEDMRRLRDWFIDSAVRAKKAGFDGVQIHIAHWYLLQAVVNIDINHRDDCYGGSPENDIRLPQEIVSGVREACGKDFIIMVKLNAHNTEAAVDDYELLASYCRAFTDAGTNLIEISGADFARKKRTDRLYYLEAVKYVKDRYPDMVLSLVGGISSRETIEEVLEVSDFASLSRALLTQPDFIIRLHRGETESSRCLHCNKCFEIFQTKYERCVFGPVIPKLEQEFSHN